MSAIPFSVFSALASSLMPSAEKVCSGNQTRPRSGEDAFCQMPKCRQRLKNPTSGHSLPNRHSGSDRARRGRRIP